MKAIGVVLILESSQYPGKAHNTVSGIVEEKPCSEDFKFMQSNQYEYTEDNM